MFYSDDRVLELQRAEIPKRFSKHLLKMKREAGVLFQPLVALEERDMLVEISKYNNKSEVEALPPTRHSKNNLSLSCKYIRFALTANLELWSINALINKEHGEVRFRMHTYSNVWNKTFFDDSEFETKRSECASQVMKVLKSTNKDVKLKKHDFILRDLNTDNDVITVEEKPSLKGVKSDIRKGEVLKKSNVVSLAKTG